MASVTIKNLTKLTAKLNKVSDLDTKRIVEKATTIVHGQAKDLAPVNSGGGSGLAGSIRMSKKKLPNGWQGRVYTNQEYAMYVEFGTGTKGNGTYPYKLENITLTYQDSPWFIPVSEISDKDAKKYHFKKVHGKDGAEYYICYGQEAKPYMYPALKNNEKAIKKLFKEGVKDKLRDICKGGQ